MELFPRKVVTGDFQLGSWLVQPRLNSICSAGESKRLEPKVMQVLVCLAEHAGEVVSKGDLIGAVWPETFVSDDALLRSISELRRVLDDDPKDPRFVQTIPKRGYRLIAEIKPVEAAGAPKRSALVRAILRRPLVLAAGLLVLAVLSAAGYLGWRWWRPSPAPSRGQVKLVVLPFENLSGDPAQDYFSDGLTDEMITQLASLQPGRLSVIARTTAMHYKGAGKRIDQIGRELGVDYVIEGAVRREKDRVRITAQLIQVADQVHLWAETYDRELSGVLSLQAEVARAVAGQIRLTLSGEKIAELASARPVHSGAYLAYLMGRYHWHRLTPEDLEAAAGHFRRAVDLDPGFARAWLGLSDSYRHLGSWWGDWPPQKAFPLAKDTMARALKLDSTLGEAHGSLGWIHFVYDWDWAKAEAEFKRGVELSPNARDARSPYANFLRRMKRLEEARREIDRCLEIDPLSPLEVMEAALLYLSVGEPKKAEQLVLRLLETTPDYRASLFGLASFYSRTGKLDKAIEYLEKTARTTRRDRLSLPSLGVAYAQAGRHTEARRVLDTLLTTPEVAQGAIAQLYVNLGEKEAAIRWWQKAFEKRDPRMVWLRLYSQDHPLWGDPRFQDLIGRMKFPQ